MEDVVIHPEAQWMYVMGILASKDSNAYQATVTTLYVAARVVITTYVMES